MRVWIDLTNSPHSLLFAPIAKALMARGDEVLVTARRFAQTVELAQSRFPAVTVVGAGAQTSLIRKATSLVGRAAQLTSVARRYRPDVAISHGSYDQVIAARVLGVPSIVAVDYEHQPANHLASSLLLPQAFAQADIDAHGGASKTTRYQGLKEEVYLSDFRAEPDQRRVLGIEGHAGPVLLLRPPPDGALYHRGENPLWDTLIEKVHALTHVRTLVLPRHPAQAPVMQQQIGAPNVHVISHPVDGPALVWWSDTVISGGGTMNREAVALGVPVWSLFAGKLGAVDEDLIGQGKMRRLLTSDDVASLSPEVRTRGDQPRLTNDVLGQFLRHIEHIAEVRSTTQ